MSLKVIGTFCRRSRMSLPTVLVVRRRYRCGLTSPQLVRRCIAALGLWLEILAHRQAEELVTIEDLGIDRVRTGPGS